MHLALFLIFTGFCGHCRQLISQFVCICTLIVWQGSAECRGKHSKAVIQFQRKQLSCHEWASNCIDLQLKWLALYQLSQLYIYVPWQFIGWEQIPTLSPGSPICARAIIASDIQTRACGREPGDEAKQIQVMVGIINAKPDLRGNS